MQSGFTITILFIWLSHFLVDIMIGIWPVYKTMAELDIAIAGIIAGASAFAGEGMQALFGTLSDRGYRKMLIIGGLLATTAGSLLAYTDNYWLLFFLFLIVCMGSGAFHPCAASLVGELSEKRKGLLITIFASGGSLGMASSQLIFTNSFYFFEGSTIVLAVPAFCLVSFMLVCGLANPSRINSGKKRQFGLKTFREFMRNKDLSRLYITQVCNQSILWGTIFLLPDVLKTREYDSWVYLGGGHLFFILGGALMMVPGGLLADRYSCKSVILTATAVGCLAYYCLLFFPRMETHFLLPLLMTMGGALVLINPVAIALGNRLVPENPGAVSALLMGLVWCVAEGIGQAGGGLLTKLFDDDAPAKALGIIGILFYVTFVVGLKLPREIPVPDKAEYA